MPDIVNFTFWGIEYFCLPVNILELYSGKYSLLRISFVYSVLVFKVSWSQSNIYSSVNFPYYGGKKNPQNST